MNQNNPSNQVTLQLTKPQLEYIQSPKVNSGFVAGFGSGKSYAGTLKTILFTQKHPKINAAYYLPTYGLIRDIAFSKFPELLTELKIPFELNRSSAEIYLPDTNNKILFRSMSNPETIVGFEVGYSIIDECDILPQEKMTVAYNKILGRNRSKLPGNTPNPIDVVGTPEGYKWFYTRFVQNFNPETDLLVRASTYSNPYLPESFVAQLKQQYPSNLIDAYLNGEFVNLNSGSVYPYFDRDRNHRSYQIKDSDILHIGQDFNVNGNVSIVCVITPDGPIVAEEIVAKDTFDTVRKLKSKFKNTIYIYPDASGNNTSSNASKTDIQILKEGGFYIRSNSKNPRINDRINTMNLLMDPESPGNFFIDTDKCPETTRALEQQAFDEQGKPEKYNNHPAIDDYVDALGYFVHKKYSMNRKPAISKFKI